MDELVLESWRTGQYGPGFDPALYAQLAGGSPWSAPDVGAFLASGGGTSSEPPLETVTVTAEKPKESFVAPPVPPTLLAPAIELAAGIGSSIAAGLGGLLGLLLPTPTAPREMDEAPTPMPELTVEGTRAPPRTPTSTLPFDTPMPPNWNDLLDWSKTRDWYSFAIPDIRFDDGGAADRRRDAAPRAPRVDQPLPVTDEITVTGRRPQPRPLDLDAPDVLGTPFQVPFGLPGPAPFAEPLPQPEPARRTKPVRIPRTLDALFDFPALDDLPSFATPFASPTPVDDLAPDLFVPVTPRLPPRLAAPDPLEVPFGVIETPGTPQPGMTPQPDFAAPPNNDRCNCAKAEPKKKRRERKPRTICRKGTYVESASGLKKSPRTLVHCETGEEFGSERM